MVLFFHLFKCHHDPTSRTRSKGLLYFKLNIHDFRSLPDFQSFKDQFFLVNPVSPEAHVAVYDIDGRVEGKCVDLFSKYWIDVHFLLGNHLYVYNKKDLIDEV